MSYKTNLKTALQSADIVLLNGKFVWSDAIYFDAVGNGPICVSIHDQISNTTEIWSIKNQEIEVDADSRVTVQARRLLFSQQRHESNETAVIQFGMIAPLLETDLKKDEELFKDLPTDHQKLPLAAQLGANQMVVGKYIVCLLVSGDWYGKDRCTVAMVHNDSDALVEFYDTTIAPESEGEPGYFIGRHFASTVLEISVRRGGLSLSGADVMSGEELLKVQCWLQKRMENYSNTVQLTAETK